MLNRIRYFNKRVTNRITRKIAGARYSPICLIRHIGRRSGKLYETPMMAVRTVDGFVFALTYGPGVDWYRNVVAAGHATLRWQGQEYAIENPQTIDAETGQHAFPFPPSLILRLLGIRHFIRMKVNEQ
jgi:deazaflavin-dependent oxidoreductase (nitroreductase family)